MSTRAVAAGLAVALLSSIPVLAQSNAEVEALKRQLQEMQENFRKQQELQQQQINTLMRQLEGLQKQQGTVVSTNAPAAPGSSATNLVEQKDAPAGASTSLAPAPWRATDPIRVRAGNAYMDIALLGTFSVGGSSARDIENGTQLGGHDPNQRGFTVQAVEANFQGAVDTYLRANANILFQIDREGESFLEVEEAYLETFTLPGNLQFRGGEYFFDFGRHNPTHTHTWAFVDIPLVNGRFLGPDGLRNPGARLSWLAPLPFYSEMFFTVANSQGETAPSFRFTEDMPGAGTTGALPFAFRGAENDRDVRGVEDMLFVPRWASAWDLTRSQTLLFGASAAFGPNASGQGGDTRTEVYGMDLTWKWKSPRHVAGYPFVTFTTEAMLRRYDAGNYDWDLNGDGFNDAGELIDPATGLPAVLGSETLQDHGFYAHVQYGFRRNWVAGLRFDYVAGEAGNYEGLGLIVADGGGGLSGTPAGPDLLRARRIRVSPNLTWFPTEFSKFRIQYNYDDREAIGVDHSVWFQFEFVLGAHGAHNF